MLLTSFVACSTAFVLPASASVRSAVPKEAKSCSALRLSNRNDDEEVNVNLVADVDAFTLTAVGFGLIAFNFFVLANVSDHRCRSVHNIPSNAATSIASLPQMGDAGLAGVVARIMNTFG